VLAATMSLPFKKKFSVLISFIVITSCNYHNNNQIAKVNFTLEGDFGHEYSQLILYREENILKAKLDTKGNESGSIQTTIDSVGLNQFDSFIKQLKQINNSGFCTTVINCKVETSEEKINKSNIDCNWNGFEKLKETLFGTHYRAKYLKSTY
jgi:hypothetical protein